MNHAVAGLPPYEIKGFLETSFLDWPGQVAAVIFLGRCNFRCPFCHNHGLVLQPDAFPNFDWTGLKTRLSRFVGWIDGVVVSGGEPTLDPRLAELAREIKGMGFKVKLDTNGSRPEVLRGLWDRGLIDHVAMDVKGPLDEVSYARAAGRPGFLGPVMETLSWLESSAVPYGLRTTVVPGLHTEHDLTLMARQLSQAPEWTLQNFNPENALDPVLRRTDPWEPDYFQDLQRKAQEAKRLAAEDRKRRLSRRDPSSGDRPKPMSRPRAIETIGTADRRS